MPSTSYNLNQGKLAVERPLSPIFLGLPSHPTDETLVMDRLISVSADELTKEEDLQSADGGIITSIAGSLVTNEA
jgi:hypothetical protein